MCTELVGSSHAIEDEQSQHKQTRRALWPSKELCSQVDELFATMFKL